ncbi:MAG: DUF6447 family protein [Rhodoferax sp.]|uniref:DUF6447 family protein n=1 Tax=Rhodoferax sp. TaxID=50421 RepID=UPI00261E7393|nr:DUF6447 family protein [Rhodoferax sp.]MDD2882215.1 DUF6447 family protein [Rhodoferax sp.]
MPQITIDNQAYDLDTLSPEARAQLTSLQFVDAELARLQAQSAVLASFLVFLLIAFGIPLLLGL